MADDRSAGNQLGLLGLLEEGDLVAADLGDPDRIDLGVLELGDIGREVLAAHWHVERQRHLLAL